MAKSTKSQGMATAITNAGVMVKGITEHQEVLALRKIDENFAKTLQANIDKCVELNKEQEALKARLKKQTEELNTAFSEMKKQASEARKIIKIDIPQSLWREFGIEDKR
jgi:hypothetical protein